jgi:hypothetical protein
MNRKLFKFSATSIANFVKNDPIVDFLDILKKEGATINNDLSINYSQTTSATITDKKRKRSESIDEPTTTTRQPSAFDYIMEFGNEFEKNIITDIKQQMADTNELGLIHEIAKSNEIKQYSQTVKALKSNKYSIITGAVLHNKFNNSYGYPDLIVTGSWLQKYIKQLLVSVFPQQYYIIDIKSSTIPLVAGNTRIGASTLFDSYKMQVFVYTDAMNAMLKNKQATTIGFILGKRYKYTQQRQTLYENSPFANIGIIDFTEKNYNKLVNDAIAFKNNLLTDWQNIKLLPIDTTIMPNMKNRFDKCYHGMKYKIAEANKDITLLWNCGHKQRKLAMERGITRYDDKQLTANILGFNEDGNIYPILSKMIEINKATESNIQSTINLSKNNNHNCWQTVMPNEWFVDFETYDSETTYDEANDFNDSLNVRNLYLIGLYGGNNEYICYLLKNEHVVLPNRFPAHFTIIYCENEKEMLEKFIIRCAGISRLIHWSTAETVIFNRKIREHGLTYTFSTIHWFDLLEVFKHREHPIIIKDCFTFGLKDVVRKLNKHGHIDLSWSDLDDGLLSAFWAKDIYIHKKDEDSRLAKLVHYNFTDCLALYIVLQFIRERVVA